MTSSLRTRQCTVSKHEILYCTAQHCTIQYCTVRCTALHCTAQYCAALYCIACAAQCSVLCSTILCGYCVLYCTVLYCTVFTCACVLARSPSSAVLPTWSLQPASSQAAQRRDDAQSCPTVLYVHQLIWIKVRDCSADFTRKSCASSIHEAQPGTHSGRR